MQRGATRSSGWQTPGGCDWSRPRRAYSPSCGSVLVVGGMVAVGFAYLFGLENTWAHRLMVVSLAGVIALVLFTIGVLDHPFSGGARISTGAFELVLNRFETSELSDL